MTDPCLNPVTTRNYMRAQTAYTPHAFIREITEIRVHFGYRWVLVMLRHEDWCDNHKRDYLLYTEQGLTLRLKRQRRNKFAEHRQTLPLGLIPNHVWGMDFVSDALFNGRRLRLLIVIDL